MKDAAEYIGIGIMVLCFCFGCSHCERVRVENDILIEQSKHPTPAQ